MVEPSGHMSPAEFREYGHAVVDWVAGYLERVGELPVLSRVRPGEVRALLPAHPPEQPEPFADLLADLDRVILPGITHWQAPGFFGYFPANASGPSVLAELVSAGLGVQGMSWLTSPAATELETAVLDWLAEALDLPAGFRSGGTGGGVISDSASSATLTALLAARERVGGGGPHDPHRLRLYASGEAHSSVAKAAKVAGLPPAAVRPVAVDERLAMDAAALDVAVTADRADGLLPFLVVATAGTTSTHAFDPLPAVGEVTRRHDLWLHVDAAHAGTAAVCPELRWVHDGLAAADSYVTNPHKALLTNFDCSAFYVRDRGPLLAALSVTPEYLRNPASASGEVIDYRDWQVPLGRRFRALKLWWVLRYYGLSGLRRHWRAAVEAAQELAGLAAADDVWELAVPAPLSLVCLAHRDGDSATQAALDRVNASGRAFVTHTRLRGRLVVRVAVGGTATRREDVLELWRLLRGATA